MLPTAAQRCGLLALLFLLQAVIVQAQQEDSFMVKLNLVYEKLPEPKKALQLAKALYQFTEQKKEYQTPANYSILRVLFEKQTPDSALARICGEKMQLKLNELVGIKPGPQEYGSDSMNQWYNSLYPKLFTTKDPRNADNAVAFLGRHPSFANFSTWNFIGYAYERNGDFTNAGKYYEKAVSVTGNEKEEYHSWMYYCNFLARSGEYLRAEEYIKRMERLATEANPLFRDGYRAEAMNAKTVYYLSVGDYSAYAQASEKNLEYYSALWHKNNNNPCDPYPAIRATNLAYAKEMTKDYTGAEKKWKTRDSLNTIWVNCYNKTYPNSHYYPLSMYPVYLVKRGKQRLAPKPLSFYAKETEEHYNSYSEYADISINYMRATHLGFLGSDRYPAIFEPILAEIKRTRNFRESTAPYINYSYFCMRDRRMDKAADIYRELFKLNEGWINDIIFSFGEKTFATYYNAKLREGYENFQSFVKIAADSHAPRLPELCGIAYNNLLFTKSISLKGTQRRKEAFLEANDPATRNLYNNWLEKKQELIRQYMRSGEPVTADTSTHTDPARMEQLQEEVTRMENELTLKAKDFKKYLQLVPPDWKTIKEKLQPGEAAIELARFSWRDQVYYSDTAYYAAYIITAASTAPEVVYFSDDAATLDTKWYKVYKNNIRYKTDDKESYQHFWKPVKDKLETLYGAGTIKRIFLSPDGVFHLVNLSTLRNPATGQYLLDETEILYTATEADINRPAAAKTSTAVLFGRPSYESGVNNTAAGIAKPAMRSYVQNFKNGQIADLPGTEEEIHAIIAAMSGSSIHATEYLREAATEDKLYTLRSPGILHIATHGYWAPAGDAVSDGYRVFNAMANSGLLFSGVVNYYKTIPYPDAYDGILTAYEAQNLNMEHTALVVLSACETSLGEMDAGEGVYGLQRAFRAAGARAVMTSLWKVDDNATRDFMISFYQAYLSGNNVANAYLSAQKQVRIKYPQPYYWGAFVMMGN